MELQNGTDFRHGAWRVGTALARCRYGSVKETCIPHAVFLFAGRCGLSQPHQLD